MPTLSRPFQDMEIAFQGLAQHLTYMDPSIILSHEDPLMWDPDALHFSQIGSYMLGKSLAKLALELCEIRLRSVLCDYYCSSRLPTPGRCCLGEGCGCRILRMVIRPRLRTREGAA